jgi:hypothetical protein
MLLTGEIGTKTHNPQNKEGNVIEIILAQKIP